MHAYFAGTCPHVSAFIGRWSVTEAHKDGMLNMREFCRWQCAVLEKYGQTLDGIYGWGVKPHTLCCHVANVLTKEEAAYYQSLYDAEVRLVLELLYKRIENPFEMLYI